MRSRMIWPAWGWFFGFLIIPIMIVALCSLMLRGPYGGIVYQVSFDNYSRSVDWLYLKILFNSIWLAGVTTVSCLLIGYPMAYAMATARRSRRGLLLMLLLLPFWTNFVVRAYAIKLLLPEGSFAVWVGMVTSYLPFLVLPVYVSLEKFDFALVEAAQDLGAPALQILKQILIPSTRQGIIAGVIFVFTPALGEFVIPDLLGGAQVMLFGNLVTDQFLKARDWPFGAALSMVLITVVLVSMGGLHAARNR